MSKETGGTAFPWVESYVNVDKGERYENYGDAGMTLRDYFAAKAMASLLVDVGFANDVSKRAGMKLDEYAAQTAYAIADAMLEARK